MKIIYIKWKVIVLIFLSSMMLTGCSVLDNGQQIEELEDQIVQLEAELEKTYAMINNVSESAIKANVMIYTTVYNTRPVTGLPSSRESGQGSGIIFSKTDTTYFIVTNHHVTYHDPDYANRTIEAIDYLGNKYTATYLFGSADYDLSIISITKTTENLETLLLATTNPEPGDLVVALGQPKGQSNTITIGKVLPYQIITLVDTPVEIVNVTFPVIAHTAPSNQGSSGGALLDDELKIVGINYGASTNQDGEWVRTYAIPIEKVIEYLLENGFTY